MKKEPSWLLFGEEPANQGLLAQTHKKYLQLILIYYDKI